MRKFNSWRLSRLLEPSAWKRLIYYQWWILTLIFCVVMWLCSYGYMPEDVERFQVIFWMSVILFVLSFIDTVLGADKHQEIKLKTTYCNIYVYNRNGRNSVGQDIIFLQDDTEAHLITKSTVLKEQGYHFYNGTFRYCIDGDNNKWYYLCEKSDEPLFLGKKMAYGGCHVFLNEVQKEGTLELCILHNQTVERLFVDSFVLGNAYVPPLAREVTLCKAENSSWQLIGEAVDEYLIVKKNNAYKVYGLYGYYSNQPRCVELSIPAIIFQEVKDRVILIRENESYTEVCRKHSVTRWVDNIIAELSNAYDGTGSVGGIVWKFDEKTKQLKKLYEGQYRALGFADGSIVGDGWEYTPNSDEGVESR